MASSKSLAICAENSEAVLESFENQVGVSVDKEVSPTFDNCSREHCSVDIWLDNNSVVNASDNESSSQSNECNLDWPVGDFESQESLSGSIEFENFLEVSRLDCTDHAVCDDKAIEQTLQLVDSPDTLPEMHNQLAKWKTENPSVTQAALSSLLCILQPHFSTLPKDARTLMNTSSTSATVKEIPSISGGSYHHFGIEIRLKNDLDENPSFSTTPITNTNLQCNMDGLPLFKSSNDQFWPILGMISKPF